MTVTLVRYFQALYIEFWREKFKFKKNEKVTRFARYDMIFFCRFRRLCSYDHKAPLLLHGRAQSYDPRGWHHNATVVVVVCLYRTQ